MGTAAARRRAPRFLRRGAASRTVRKVSTNRWRRRAAAPPRRHAPCGRGCRRWRGRCGRRRRCSRRDGCSGGHPARRRSARRRLRRRRGAVPRGCGSGRASNSRTTASARCRPPAGCRWAARPARVCGIPPAGRTGCRRSAEARWPAAMRSLLRASASAAVRLPPRGLPARDMR